MKFRESDLPFVPESKQGPARDSEYFCNILDGVKLFFLLFCRPCSTDMQLNPFHLLMEQAEFHQYLFMVDN